MFIELTHKTQISFNSAANGQLTFYVIYRYFLLFPAEKHAQYITLVSYTDSICILYSIFVHWYQVVGIVYV